MVKWIRNKLQKLFFKIFLFRKSYFKKITVVSTTPEIQNLKEKEFVEVNYKNKSYWVLFRCPCGCGDVITLSTQNSHIPHWKIFENKFGLPSLSPSIWQKRGCYSHFWVKNGKIHWCNITGVKPNQ